MTKNEGNDASALSPTGRFKALLERALVDTGIPTCPAILDRIHIELGKDEPDLNLLARIISSDVSLAGGLISISNSPCFGVHRRVRSVSEALKVLGLGITFRAISGLILHKIFPVTLSMERFWDASSSIARLSGWLAQRPDIGIRLHASDAYTFGLFRDCGIAVLLNRYPYYPEVLAQANAEKTLSFTQIEELQCPTNHALIGSLLAQSWMLPEEISTAIRVHHEYAILRESDATVLPPATRGLIATAQLAEHIFQHHTGLSQSQEWHKSRDVCLKLLEIGEDQLPDLYEEAAQVLA